MKEMEITILGSGTCVPSLTRHTCSVFARTGNSRLLFDTGTGTMRRLLEAGQSIFDVTHLFYSHLHPDHTGELVSLLFSLKNAGDLKRTRPLTIIAARGFTAFFEKLQAAYGRWLELEPGMLEIIELHNKKKDGIRFDDFTVDTLPMDHTDQSIAFKISLQDGPSFVYSGDTDVTDNLVELARETDLLICESSHPDELKVKGHLTPSLAGEMAARAHVKKLVLTHFYPVCESVDMTLQCRKTFGGEIVLAEDLMTLKIFEPL